jgi:thiol-disulfide isomerase/thioredoxin
MFLSLVATLYWYSNWSQRQSPAMLPSPAFSLEPIAQNKRKVFRLDVSPTKGKLLYINFWAHWCEPCLREIPTLLAWSKRKEVEDLIDIAFINLDREQDSLLQARAFMDHLYVDKNRSLFFGHRYSNQELGLGALPSHWFVDREGRVAIRFSGDITEALDELLPTLSHL